MAGSLPARTIPNVTCVIFSPIQPYSSVLDESKGSWGRGLTYSRIKQTPTNPIESPHIHQQTKPIYQRGKYVLLATRSSAIDSHFAGLRVQHDLAHEREVQKHESADELARRGDDVCCEGADMRCLAAMVWFAVVPGLTGAAFGFTAVVAVAAIATMSW